MWAESAILILCKTALVETEWVASEVQMLNLLTPAKYVFMHQSDQCFLKTSYASSYVIPYIRSQFGCGAFFWAPPPPQTTTALHMPPLVFCLCLESGTEDEMRLFHRLIFPGKVHTERWERRLFSASWRNQSGRPPPTLLEICHSTVAVITAAAFVSPPWSRAQPWHVPAWF